MEADPATRVHWMEDAASTRTCNRIPRECEQNNVCESFTTQLSFVSTTDLYHLSDRTHSPKATHKWPKTRCIRSLWDGRYSRIHVGPTLQHCASCVGLSKRVDSIRCMSKPTDAIRWLLSPTAAWCDVDVCRSQFPSLFYKSIEVLWWRESVFKE